MREAVAPLAVFPSTTTLSPSLVALGGSRLRGVARRATEVGNRHDSPRQMAPKLISAGDFHRPHGNLVVIVEDGIDGFAGRCRSEPNLSGDEQSGDLGHSRNVES